MTNVGTLAVPEAARIDLASTGKLRAGINLSNTLLSTRDCASGEVRGVAVDLARELGRRIGVAVETVCYDSPGQMADAAQSGNWDIAFLAAEPARAATISFTGAYAEIEATYLVPKDSPLRSIAEVDREGVRIALSARSAYDLYLTRSLQRARLVRGEGLENALKLFVDEGMEALAGLRPMLVEYAARISGSQVLAGKFTAIQQAIGVPVGRNEGARFLREFVENGKRSGLVWELIVKHDVRGLSVAPIAADSSGSVRGH